MHSHLKLAVSGAALALTALLLTGAAAHARDSSARSPEARYSATGQALPPQPAAVEIPGQASTESVRAANARLGDGWRWESRPESIFGGRVLILPAGATIAPWQAAEELGASAVQDSGWAKDGGPAGRVWQQPNGWTAGSGGWAHVQAPTSGLINRILYVQWR